MTSDERDHANLIDGRYAIEDLVDLEHLQSLFERFTEATGFTIGFLNHPQMDILVATGWRDICTRYHRECPAALDNCLESNRRLLDQLDEPGKLVIEPCDNGLVDCATPIIVQGVHVASLATGQVLLEKPDLDRFRRQAREFGADEADYLAALAEIPVVDEQRLKVVTAFLGEMARVISQVGYARLLREFEVIERQKAEASLRESEQKYRELFEGAAEGILVADLETRELQFANSSACEMFGYTREELTHLSIRAIHPEESLPMAVAEFEAQARGEKLLASEIPCLRKDGSVFHADISTRPVVFDGRTMNVGFFTDVSERRHAAEERRRLETQLALAQRMEAIGRLAGGVAHDFNNLLSVVIGFTDIAMLKTREGDPLRTDLEQIAEAGQRAASLTRQLLAFSRKQDLELEPLDLGDVVSKMEQILRRTIGEDIEFVIVLGEELGAVKGDRGRVEQVIMNLALNARDAMPGGGCLTIEVANSQLDEAHAARFGDLAPGAYVMLSVTDTGSGMDETTRVQIFEPFFTTKEPGKGTGLGLSTVYGTVTQSGGTIRAFSEPGKGSTFQIHLPRVDEVVGTEPPTRVGERCDRGTETIVVVEDDDAVRNLARSILVTAGYDVHAAANGGEAILLAEQLDGTIDLLLTDVVMPRMQGTAVADRVASLCPGIKILFMSGYTHDLVEPRVATDRDTHFIAKPFNAADLTRKVREVLDQDR